MTKKNPCIIYLLLFLKGLTSLNAQNDSTKYFIELYHCSFCLEERKVKSAQINFQRNAFVPCNVFSIPETLNRKSILIKTYYLILIGNNKNFNIGKYFFYSNFDDFANFNYKKNKSDINKYNQLITKIRKNTLQLETNNQSKHSNIKHGKFQIKDSLIYFDFNSESINNFILIGKSPIKINDSSFFTKDSFNLNAIEFNPKSCSLQSNNRFDIDLKNVFDGVSRFIFYRSAPYQKKDTNGTQVFWHWNNSMPNNNIITYNTLDTISIKYKIKNGNDTDSFCLSPPKLHLNSLITLIDNPNYSLESLKKLDTNLRKCLEIIEKDNIEKSKIIQSTISQAMVELNNSRLYQVDNYDQLIDEITSYKYFYKKIEARDANKEFYNTTYFDTLSKNLTFESFNREHLKIYDFIANESPNLLIKNNIINELIDDCIKEIIENLNSHYDTSTNKTAVLKEVIETIHKYDRNIRTELIKEINKLAFRISYDTIYATINNKIIDGIKKELKNRITIEDTLSANIIINKYLQEKLPSDKTYPKIILKIPQNKSESVKFRDRNNIINSYKDFFKSEKELSKIIADSLLNNAAINDNNKKELLKSMIISNERIIEYNNNKGFYDNLYKILKDEN